MGVLEDVDSEVPSYYYSNGATQEQCDRSAATLTKVDHSPANSPNDTPTARQPERMTKVQRLVLPVQPTQSYPV